MYVQKSVTAQELPNEFEKTLNENDWESNVKFRVRDGEKYADVRLFRSHGTDNETRNLGMAFGYNTSKSIFSDNRIISEMSSLGIIGTGDGETRTFNVKVFPIDQLGGVNVYVDGVRINNNRFAVDYIKGFIQFKEAPSDGVLISVSYKLDKTAPEPPDFLVFFTYSSVNLATNVSGSTETMGTPIKIADGDGVTITFKTPTAPIKAGSMKVWKDSVLLYEDIDFTIDLSTGDVTFITAPELGKELTATYIQIVQGTSTAEVGTGDGSNKVFYTPVAPVASTLFAVIIDDVELATTEFTANYKTGEVTLKTAPAQGSVVTLKYIDLTGGPATGSTFLGDITSKKTFDPTTPIGTMHGVYAALDFINPSLPTVLSFSENGLGNAWQRDSHVHFWGQINKNSAMLWTRPDAGANPKDALFAPLYFGRILATHKKPMKNMVIFSGAATKQEITWKKGLVIGGINMDYGPRTSNGNSSVQLTQTVGGSYYQAHGFSMMTHSMDADNGEGYFNPSQYLTVNDGGIAKPARVFSQLKMVHPNDGYAYEFDHVSAMHAKKVSQNNLMRVRKEGKSEIIGFGDGYRRKFILSHNKHASSNLTIIVDCIALDPSMYTYETETKTVTFKEAPAAGHRIQALYDYKQMYQFNLATAPRCPMLLKETMPFIPMGAVWYKEELDE